MDQFRLTIAMVVLSSLGLASCSKSSEEQPAAPGDLAVLPARTAAGRVDENPVPAAPPAAPELLVIDEKQLADILEKHQGEVVLVDFWATWCLECLELMPHTVELREKLSEQGLQVILVSLDSLEARREAIQKLLVKNGATFKSYVSQYGGDPKSAEAFQIESAVLPNIKLYDRKGSLRKVFSAGRMPPEPFDAQDVERAVRELLAEE